MSISPIDSLPNWQPVRAFGMGLVGMAEQIPATDTGIPAVPAAKADFGSLITQKLSELDTLHKNSDALAVRALTGDMTDIHEYTIAANQASVATQLAVAVRNRGVEAFTEIMRMQL